MESVLISTFSALVGVVLGIVALGNWASKRINSVQTMADKHEALFLLMNQWVRIKQTGKNLSLYFVKNGYKKIAIYGISYVGETLLDELEKSDVEVAYCIDKNADRIIADMDIVSVDTDFEDVDAIVVTAISAFDEIEEKLSNRVKCPILSLEDILYEI